VDGQGCMQISGVAGQADRCWEQVRLTYPGTIPDLSEEGLQRMTALRSTSTATFVQGILLTITSQ
jgi:hypothetical protein